MHCLFPQPHTFIFVNCLLTGWVQRPNTETALGIICGSLMHKITKILAIVLSAPSGASTVAVPEIQAKQRFNAHPVPHPKQLDRFRGRLRQGFGLPVLWHKKLAMAENHIKTESMGLQCAVQCRYEQSAHHRHE